MKLSASATWVGGPSRGKGVVTTKSCALSQTRYFPIGHAKGKGFSPYELIAAAHAACFSATLAHELAEANFSPQRIETAATLTMEALLPGWTVTAIQLDVVATVPRAKQGDFIQAAVRAKTNCTISRLLKTNIAMSAKLEHSEIRHSRRGQGRTDSGRVSEAHKQSIC